MHLHDTLAERLDMQFLWITMLVVLPNADGRIGSGECSYVFPMRNIGY